VGARSGGSPGVPRGHRRGGDRAGSTGSRGTEATDLYPVPGFFAGGLTSASSWAEILRTPGVVGDFPYIGFGVRFVPLNLTCLAEGKLRPLDSSLPGEGPAAREGGCYPVSVFKVIPTNINPVRVLLFTKTFDVPACPTR
jgi:hypothetical protein